MKKLHLIDFCKKHKLGIGVVVSAAIGLALALWFGYASLSKLDTKADYEILNDEYSVLSGTLSPDTEIVQFLQLRENTDIYGVRLKLQNDGAAQGTIHVRLYDAQENLLAEGSALCAEVLNDDFTTFFFDHAVTMRRGGEYSLSVSCDSADGALLSLWKSEESISGYRLVEDGVETAGTVALQTVTRSVLPSVHIVYWFFALLLAAFCAGVFWLIFIRKAKIQTIFVSAAAVIGLVFCFFTPQLAAPDEYVHYTTSYYYASGLLGKAQKDEQGRLLVRPCDAPQDGKLFVTSHPYDAYAYTELAQGLTLNDGTNECTIPVQARLATSVFPLVYLPQTAGIALARLLNLGYGWTLIFGRVINLLVYIGLVWTAIRLIPFGKSVLFAVALFPMSLQLAGSLSYDTLVNGCSFLFIALCLKFTYADKTVSWKQMLWLAVLGALLSPSKAVYLVLAALCLIIPQNKYPSRLAARGSKAMVLGLSFAAWFAYSFSDAMSIFRANPVVTDAAAQQAAADAMQSASQAVQTVSEIAPNGDSRLMFTVGYILSHLEQTVALVINTIQQNMSLYLQGLIGGRLGEIIVTKIEVSWVLIIGILLVTLLCTLRTEQQAVVLKGGRRIWSLLVFAGVSALIVFACITWTPANYTTIFGIQGRYFLPVLPLALLALCNNTLVLKKDITRQLCYLLCLLDVLVLYDAFAVVCSI